jgi:hypothetical protein
MSTAAEIEGAIRQLPETEIKRLATWLEAYLLRQTSNQPPGTSRAFEKWRGHGKLPIGHNADEYLQLTRDARTFEN